MIEYDLPDALYNLLAAGSVADVAWYNKAPPATTAPPYGIIDVYDSTAMDSGNRTGDEWRVDIKVVYKMTGDYVDNRLAGSYAGDIRAAMTGPAAINSTGSLAGGYSCTGLLRGGYINGTAGEQHRQAGYTYTIRVSK